MTLLTDLGVTNPVLAAPMAGGPTTPELVIAAARAGSLGFLAGGYKPAAALAEQLEATAAVTVGVNLFAPNPLPVQRSAYDRYRDELRPDAERYGVELPEEPVEDDDAWRDKIDLLLASPVPVVSFTFGIPEAAVVEALHRAGSLLVQTVTSADEARQAADAGLDALAVQGSSAGGHSGTLTPQKPLAIRPLTELLTEIGHATDLPRIAAGGLTSAAEVAVALRLAVGVAVGTALLLAPEAGTSAAHRAALTGPSRAGTVLTRAFTGRPARALPNRFVHDHDASAPLGYPALHHLTRPLRAAAAAAADPELVNLWAGTGYHAAIAKPAEEILGGLAAAL
ncbi:nitronate monooxygenase [Jatrophihabitans sp.]|uniref:nitronate monooxygenase n=1 Tax=Jatrophihabitans sp. TaxID=1932789 RepID=UPI0030C6988E|nr:2-nitropropane dioxygenase [Jatrophihabitans sp.]